MLRLGIVVIALLVGGAAAVWKKRGDKKPDAGEGDEPSENTDAGAESQAEPAKSEKAKPKAAKPAKSKKPKAAKPAKSKKSKPKAEKASAATKLTKIEGIGPKLEELLVAGGIGSCEELVKSSTGELKKILDEAGPRFRLQDPSTWIEQAELAVAGKWDELAKLKGGRRV